MPALPPATIGSKIAGALEAAGRPVLIVGSAASQPRRFRVSDESESLEIWTYAWTVTHGGGPMRPAGERRIQMTGVSSPLMMNPAGPTLLLGFHPDLGVFAGFDIQRHRMFTPGSPSVQIDVSALEQCLETGLALNRKGNGEVAIGIRPDMLLDYAQIAGDLHAIGAEADALSAAERATSAADPGDLSALPQERQRLVRAISRLSRAQDFRRRVLTAYENRCAVTRMQMNLVEAAHLIPVSVPNSTDRTQNGIALSPTFHRAMDARLIYLDEDFRFKINPDRRESLLASGQGAGLEMIKAAIDRPIFLPADSSLRPTVSILRMAKRSRGIA